MHLRIIATAFRARASRDGDVFAAVVAWRPAPPIPVQGVLVLRLDRGHGELFPSNDSVSSTLSGAPKWDTRVISGVSA